MSIFDQKLSGRIQQFKADHPFSSIETVADTLKKNFQRDYGRIKTVNFREQCKKIQTDLLKSGKIPLPGNQKKKEQQDDSSESEEMDGLVEYKNSNALNMMIRSVYKNAGGDPQSKTPIKLSHEAENYEEYEKNMRVTKPKTTELVTIVDGETNGEDSVSGVGECETPASKKNGGEKRKKTSGSSSSVKKKAKRRRKTGNENGMVDDEGNSLAAAADGFGAEKMEFKVDHQVDVTFDDIGGDTLDIKRQVMCKRLSMRCGGESAGLLLHGASGCGKTITGRAMAAFTNLPLVYINASDVVASMSGESEKRIRDLFETAKINAPCVLFIDKIEAIGGKRENASKAMEVRIVTQLAVCMDEAMKGSERGDHGPLLVVGATSDLTAIDSQLRRSERFETEILMRIPNEADREDILKVICRGKKISTEVVDVRRIAHLTPGYVGADLKQLCKVAREKAAVRTVTTLHRKRLVTHDDVADIRDFAHGLDDRALFGDSVEVSTEDFEAAMKEVQPSAQREGFATVPDVTWNDIGAMEGVRESLSYLIMGPVHNPKMFKLFGLTQASGVMLAGPPGCGKTLVAKAVANEAGINFISVKGPELLNMYVGESERAVRQVFERARSSAPCVIFFDEFDALCPKRSSSENRASTRVVNQLLTELDGLESRKKVYIIAATNRLDTIDPAMLRPGRLDKTLYVGIPSAEDRIKIFKTITKNGTEPPFSDEINLEELGRDERCNGFSGADCSALIREASMSAVKDFIKGRRWGDADRARDNDDDLVASERDNQLTPHHIDVAFAKIKPSVSQKDRQHYEKMQRELQQS